MSSKVSFKDAKEKDERSPLLAANKSSFRRRKPADHRKSVRGSAAARYFESEEIYTSEGSLSHKHLIVPVGALSPLVAGGVIKTTDGYVTAPRPASSVKSLPAFAPFPSYGTSSNFLSLVDQRVSSLVEVQSSLGPPRWTLYVGLYGWSLWLR